MHDLIILGAGPAGLSAGIYAARYGLKTIIIGEEIGGTANHAEILENFPGFTGKGKELMEKMAKQAKQHGAEILVDEILNIKKSGKEFIVKTEKKEFTSKAVIFALGTEHKKLEIPGEKKYLGKGVSHCLDCDAPLFREKTVAVIGGGSAAISTAIVLGKYASKIYLLYRGDKLKAEKALIEKALKNKNIEIIYNSVPVEIKGNNIVSSIIVEENGKKKEHKVDGIFINAGKVPTPVLEKELGVKTDEQDYIIVDSEMKTGVEGVFAAGDSIKGKLKQIVTAAAQGAIAAKSAYDFLSLG